ncbi:MAG: UDP-N-acetylglucosamine--N-acetylmuramyl-(pentapeptide) pyrophosphoryl-undecaprenol N-acetylglucosamine transferase [Firmicutes bacterium]|nr:UDP-N-acetylglucosamine--N-acetylmuramyl-(pentapeptide) pyrophosphoryl-undecaprenol N-acetylglucosamine transferase [Bacillota bacterium]
MKKILFTGGGSAGHIVPNIALIDILKGEADVCYMGTDGLEKDLISALKIPYFEIACPKLIRSFSFRNLKIPAEFLRAEKKAAEGLKTFCPDVVFSKGGYVALPVVFAAKKMKIPCLTHESDLSPGLANRLMAGKCRYVLTSFPETAERIRNGKYCGSPLRKELFEGDRAAAKKKYGFSGSKKVLLVFGGGSGSRAINEGLRKCVAQLAKKYYILHLCGKGNAVESNIPGYVQKEFESDMASAYAAADLVISRSGSNTVFEILALKKPSVLIPLEGQTRGDQAENAAYFQKRHLCRVLRQSEIDFLPEAIEDALKDEELFSALSVSEFSGGNGNILHEIRRFLV